MFAPGVEEICNKYRATLAKDQEGKWTKKSSKSAAASVSAVVQGSHSLLTILF